MKYLVSVPVFASVNVEVEASSKEEAIEKAAEQAHVCHQCARDVELGGIDARHLTIADASEME